ncbi:MAG: hypothetical protein RLZZ163_1208 [Actinomycetota bacterium]
MDDRLALAAHPRPRRLTRRGVTVGLVLIAVFALAYFLVARAYQIEGGSVALVTGEQVDPDISILASPVDFDARTATLTMRFEFSSYSDDLVDEGNRLKQGVRVTIGANDGIQEFHFAQGEPMGFAEAEVGVDGEIYAYPFDKYQGFVGILTETFKRGAGGVNETTGQLTSTLAFQGAIGGWDFSSDTYVGGDASPFADITLTRAFSSKAFAFVLLAMAASVAVLVLIVALLSFTYRRRFEVALLTWNGAVLFSLPLLRTYLPGNPPIGAAIDIYLYLWLFVISVTSIVLLIIAWSEQKKAELLEEARRRAAEA